ncbi:ApeA N-terminal domain 1-containing protein [Oceanobacillus sp. FSL W7-1309]|uniref:ApeA N-terminal domain 1-containing protein n=1 Tax=Oceanobacillus sp. FSL W7-1309 TaxID=2954539 RepID=UPI0030F74052
MEVSLSATGSWRIDNSDKEYYGDLYLNKDEGGIALYIRIPNNGPIMSFLELPLNIPFIKGSTMNGAKITLLDCIRIKTESRIGSEEVFGYQANYMLDGVDFETKDDIRFSKMKISIPGIIEWGNISNYSRPKYDGKRDVLIELDITEPIEIYSNEVYSLSYFLDSSYPGFNLVQEEITLKQTPYLIIESNSLQPLDWFMSKAKQMKRLIEIAMAEPFGFDKMIIESPEIYYEFDDNEKKPNRAIKVIHANRENIRQKSNNRRRLSHDFLFSLNELRNANFPKWQSISPVMEPIIELYIDSLYNEKLSTSRHFQNMVQALETYHSRRICNTLPDFKKRVEQLISIRPEGFKDEDRNFLLNGSYKYVTLRSRLADLLLADYTFYFYTAEIHHLDFPKVIADTRNYYTHYDKKLEDRALKGEDLINGFHILRNILEFYLLKEFGFEEEFIHERIRERIKPIIISNDVKKADKNQRYD